MLKMKFNKVSKISTALLCSALMVAISAQAQSNRRVKSNKPFGPKNTTITHQWKNNIIPVCWEKVNRPSAFARNNNNIDRVWVKDAVEKSWDAISDINFTGWGECEETAQGIRILISNQMSDEEPSVRYNSYGHDPSLNKRPYTKGLGPQIDGVKNGMVLFNDFPYWKKECAQTIDSRERCIRTMAVHQFGHALGLSHLQSSARQNDISVCAQEPNVKNALNSYKLYSGSRNRRVRSRLYWKKDAKSIMNYCRDSWESQGTLSPLDVSLVRSAYGPYDSGTAAHLKAYILIRGRDNEYTYSLERDEKKRERHTLEFDLIEGARPKQTISMCVGGEVRIEVDIEPNIYRRGNEIGSKSNVRLFEGTSCDTDSLEAQSAKYIAILAGSLAKSAAHDVEDDGDRAQVDIIYERTFGDVKKARTSNALKRLAQKARYFNPTYTQTTATGSKVQTVEVFSTRPLAPMHIQNTGGKLCLRAPSGINAIVNTCTLNTSKRVLSDQRWVLRPLGHNQYTLYNQQKKTCLNLVKSRENRDGGHVSHVGCSGHLDQKWVKIPTNNRDIFKLKNVSSGRCLAVHNARTEGVQGRLSVYSCRNHEDQYWQLADKNTSRRQPR